MTKSLFWISVAFPLYVYIGFPLLLWLLVALVRRAPRAQSIEPSVSLLVAAYNEAAVIADKIRNSLALDYPAEKLEIVVASDGSEDATAEIVRSFEAESGGRVRLLNYPQNRGKMAVLNAAIPELRGDIVAFSDATSMLAANSLRILVQSFSDPLVGAASGVYRLLKQDQAQSGAQEDIYWRYETFLKVQEARLGAFTALWLWTDWHYRFRWLLGAYLLLIATFAAILTAPNLAVLIAAQIFFGGAIGLIYYSSLFYSMDAGDTKGEHGGIHEAAIGLGNCVGPATGAAALWLAPENASIGAWAVSGLLTLGLGGLFWIRTSHRAPVTQSRVGQ